MHRKLTVTLIVAVMLVGALSIIPQYIQSLPNVIAPTIVPSVLKNRIVQGPPADPVTIVTGLFDWSTVTLPFQRQTCFANGYYWAFYFKGIGNFHFASSKDGVTWGADTSVWAFNTGWSSQLSTRCVTISGTSYVYYTEAYDVISSCSGAQNTIFYDRGTLNSDGTITWKNLSGGCPASIATGRNSVCGGGDIAVDDQNHMWMGYDSGAAACGNPIQPWVLVCSGTGDTCGTFTEIQLTATGVTSWGVSLAPISGGQMQATYSSTSAGNDFTALCSNGGTCGTGSALTAGTANGNIATVSDSLNNVYFAWGESTVMKFRILTAGSLLGSESAGTASISANPALVEISFHTFYIFWIDSSTTVKFAQRVSGTWQTPGTAFTDVGIPTVAQTEDLSLPTTWNGATKTIGILYAIDANFPSNCTLSGCTVRFATFPATDPISVANIIQPVLALDMNRELVDKNLPSPFSADQRSILLDASPYQNNPTSTAPSTMVAGAIGQGQKFDGTSNYWSVADTPSLEFNFQGNFLTLATWMFPTALPTTSTCMMQKYQEYGLCLWADGKVMFRMWNGVGWTTDNSTTAVITLNKWWNVVGIWNSTTLTLYVNSVQVNLGTAFVALPTVTANPLCIGSSTTSADCTTSASYYTGILDEMYIYKRALSGLEIFNEMTTPITAFPTTRISFTSGSGAFIGNNPELPQVQPDAVSAGQAAQAVYNIAQVRFHSIIKLNVSETGLDTNDYMAYLFSFYHLGVREMTYEMTIRFSGFGASSLCSNNPYCSLQLDWYTIDNTGTQSAAIQELFIRNATAILPCCTGVSWLGDSKTAGCCWLAIDQWITQDISQIAIRVSNQSQDQTCAWTNNPAPGGAACPTLPSGSTISPSQFVEYFFNLKDTAGNLHPASWFDGAFKTETFLYGGHTGSGLRQFTILFHREGRWDASICGLAAAGAGIITSETLIGAFAVAFATYSFCVGVLNPSSPVTAPNCGAAQFLCSTITTTYNLFNGAGSAVGAATGGAIGATANDIANAILAAFANSYKTFASALDTVFALISGNPGSTYFSTFISNVGNVITTFAGQIVVIAGSMFANFANTVTLAVDVGTFFASLITQLDLFFTNYVINPGVSVVSGITNLFSLFNAFACTGTNGSCSFSIGGVTYNFGTSGVNNIVTGAVVPFALALSPLLLLMYLAPKGFATFSAGPIEGINNILRFFNYMGLVLFTILQFLFRTFREVISFLRGFIPFMGG